MERSESFADHYSQARQFFASQTEIERKHIGDALVFELSKVKMPRIREAVLSHLPNIDKDLAKTVAGGLGMDVPKPAKPAEKPKDDLKPSDALSIVKNGPDTFAERKLGLFVSEGAPASLVKGLRSAVKKADAVCEMVTPKIGGVTLDNGDELEGDEKIDGGPSVLYDAVALMMSEEGVQHLAEDAPSRDFVTDAFAHCKFIAFNEPVRAMFEAVGLVGDLDEGCVELTTQKSARAFVDGLGPLRYWDREMAVDADA
ncbi:MAG: catalase-related domain-containing protein [Parvularcula sp.]|nr:catalase-related domain-containing protein [Parvularcula sp.]